MDEVIRSMPGQQFIGLVAVVAGIGGGALIALVAIAGSYWRAVRTADAEAQLKRDLVAAGFGADEIERVVTATVGERPTTSASPRTNA